MRSTLVDVLAILANGRIGETTVPYMVSVLINDTYLGDINRSSLPLVLSSIPFEVGDDIRFYATDTYEWDEVIEFDLTISYMSERDGWIPKNDPALDREEKQKSRAPERNQFKITVADGKGLMRLLPGAKKIHKREASKKERRLSRVIINEQLES